MNTQNKTFRVLLLFLKTFVLCCFVFTSIFSRSGYKPSNFLYVDGYIKFTYKQNVRNIFDSQYKTWSCNM